MAVAANLAEVETAASRWEVPFEDALLIALNQSGVHAPDDGRSRVRVMLRLTARPADPVFVILSLGRRESPFVLRDGELAFGGVVVASVQETEDDDAVLSYFRKGKLVMTLNSNARSQCVGCAFCPNTMEAASDPRLAVADDLTNYLAGVARQQGWEDLSEVEKITVCTGCFHREDRANEHLAAVRRAMSDNANTGTLHFLSSVMRNRDSIARAAASGPFELTVTVECFDRRKEVLKQSKADLSPSQVTHILDACNAEGVAANYTYIIGLDEMEPALTQLAEYASRTSAFPLFQIFQPHSAFMDMYVVEGGRKLDYYLQFRRELERLFVDSDLRPRPWENYRPLWYFAFAGEPIEGPRK